MENNKDKIIKRYYKVLIGVILLYLVVSMILQYLNIINIFDNKIFYLFFTLLYYLIVKNLLSNYFKGKIYDIDPDIKKREYDKNQQKKDKLISIGKVIQGSKLYKSKTFIYVIVLIIIFLIFNL